MQSLNASCKPMVSVIVPVYNRQNTIARALNSIKQQSFADFEVIIIDDGSTDNSQQVIAPYLQDRRFHYVRQANSGKPSLARNAAVKRARGEWLAFLDSDDEWPVTQLHSQIQTLLAFRTYQVGMVFTDNRKYLNGVPLKDSFFARLGIEQALNAASERDSPSGRLFHSLAFQRLLCRQGFVMTQGVLVNRHLWHQQGGFDTTLTFAEDTDCWLKLSGLCRIAQAYGPGFNYHCHGQNMTSGLNIQHYKDSIRVLQRHEQRLADDSISVRYLRARKLAYRLHLLISIKQAKHQYSEGLPLRDFLNVKWNKALIKALLKSLRWLPLHLSLRC